MKPSTRKLVLVAALACSAIAFAATTMQTLLSATASGAGSAFDNIAGPKTYQAVAKTTSGTGTAVISIQGSNDATNWDPVGSISLTLTTTFVSDSFTSDDRYTWVRANATTLSGNTPTLTVTRSF